MPSQMTWDLQLILNWIEKNSIYTGINYSVDGQIYKVNVENIKKSGLLLEMATCRMEITLSVDTIYIDICTDQTYHNLYCKSFDITSITWKDFLEFLRKFQVPDLPKSNEFVGSYHDGRNLI